MANAQLMPKLGLTMTEGTIEKWHKNVGDTIEKGDLLFEVSTDKLTNEIESDFSGVVLKLCGEEGDTIACKEPVCYIGEAGEKIEEAVTQAAAPASEDKAVSADVTSGEPSAKPVKHTEGGYIPATPYAKKLAKEKGYTLADIPAGGPNGTVVAKDVLAYVPGAAVKASPLAVKVAADAGIDPADIFEGKRIMKSDVLAAAARKRALLAGGAVSDEDQVVKLSAMRRGIAKNMANSWTTSPRVTFNHPVDATAMKDLRKKLAPGLKEKGIKLTFNHILMMVCSRALTEFPEINSSLDGDMLTLHSHVNMGLAVGLDNGLVVPKVKCCDLKSLSEIAVETEDMVNQAKEGKLSIDDMTGGTFTITNLGAFGITSFSPIINQPEMAILGVNAIVDTPVVVDGQIEIRPMMNLSLTADHRIVDGVTAAKFLQRVAGLLENPYMLLV